MKNYRWFVWLTAGALNPIFKCQFLLHALRPQVAISIALANPKLLQWCSRALIAKLLNSCSNLFIISAMLTISILERKTREEESQIIMQIIDVSPLQYKYKVCICQTSIYHSISVCSTLRLAVIQKTMWTICGFEHFCGWASSNLTYLAPKQHFLSYTDINFKRSLKFGYTNVVWNVLLHTNLSKIKLLVSSSSNKLWSTDHRKILNLKFKLTPHLRITKSTEIRSIFFFVDCSSNSHIRHNHSKFICIYLFFFSLRFLKIDTKVIWP